MIVLLKKIAPYIILVILAMVIFRQCNEEPKIITKTKVEYVDRIDTIKDVVIQEVPTVRYIEKVKTIKGKDSIVYLDDNEGIKANEYNTQLNSNNATATLKILTTGELLDVSGTINYKEKVITEKTTEFKNNSGVFLYGQTSVVPQFEQFAIGVDWQIKNTIIIGANVGYNLPHNQTSINLKVGFRIF